MYQLVDSTPGPAVLAPPTTPPPHEDERFQSWQTALQGGEPFLDVSRGAAGLVIRWEGRPWVVILSRPTQPMSARLSARWPVDATLIASRP